MRCNRRLARPDSHGLGNTSNIDIGEVQQLLSTIVAMTQRSAANMRIPSGLWRLPLLAASHAVHSRLTNLTASPAQSGRSSRRTLCMRDSLIQKVQSLRRGLRASILRGRATQPSIASPRRSCRDGREELSRIRAKRFSGSALLASTKVDRDVHCDGASRKR
jgi:hypothetical protein